MSEWITAKPEDIELSENKEVLEVWVKQDNSGNIYVEVPVAVALEKMKPHIDALLDNQAAEVREEMYGRMRNDFGYYEEPTKTMVLNWIEATQEEAPDLAQLSKDGGKSE